MKNEIRKLRNQFDKLNIDGYVVPKNDEYFTEYSKLNRLKIISDFTGSAGIAVILKKKNYLFTDGRYTIQSKIESGKYFKIVNIEEIINCKLFRNITLGVDPKLFTYNQIKKFFLKNNKVKFISENLIDNIKKQRDKKTYNFYSLKNNIVGEKTSSKLTKISKFLLKNNSDYIFVSAPENVAWILNIRGSDIPNTPMPNCRLIISKTKKIFLISKIEKCKTLLKEKIITLKQIIDINEFSKKNFFFER